MPPLPKIPRMGNIDWDKMLAKRMRARDPAKLHTLLEHGAHQSAHRADFEGALQRNDDPEYSLEALRDDLSQQIALRSPQEAASIVPAGRIRQRIRELGKGNKEQQIGGVIGATGGGLLGAGAGALATGLAKGRSNAKWGLLAGLPAAMAGHSLGTKGVRDNQLLSMLDEELGPGAGIKQAYVEEGFDEILGELHDAKKDKTLDFSKFKNSIKDLKEGRGRGLIPSERLLLRKHILEQASPQPQDAPWVPREGAKSPAVTAAQPNTPKVPRAPKHKRVPHWVGKKPLAVLGGLAALSGLGIGAAHFWPKDKEPGEQIDSR